MSKEQVNSNKENLETLRNIVNDVEVVMLSSIDHEGRIVSRPMQTQELEFDGDLWFITKKDTDKYEEVQVNPNVNISVVGKSYASISGKAYFINDRSRIKKYWNKFYEEMFEADYHDPDLIMVKVELETAEYWDTGNRTGMIVNFFKNLTGNEEDKEDINETIEFK